jgi:hypothetical protein
MWASDVFRALERRDIQPTLQLSQIVKFLTDGRRAILQRSSQFREGKS